MGSGTGTEEARRTEEPAVETQTPLTDGLDVELDPADVWTLGQLIEAGAVSFPPGVAHEITTGYRVLQAGGYEPPEDAETEVELKGSGEASPIDLDLEDLDGDADVTARQVVLTEVVTEETEHVEAGATVEPSVEETRSAGDGEAGHDGTAAQADQRLQPAARLPAAEETEELTSAIERLAEGIEAAGDAVPAQLEPPSTQKNSANGALALDWAMIGLGLGVSTLLVIAAAFVTDPVFSILGLALLLMCVFQSLPYLAESADEDAGPTDPTTPQAPPAPRSYAHRVPLKQAGSFFVSMLVGGGAVALFSGTDGMGWGYIGAFAVTIALGVGLAVRADQHNRAVEARRAA